ncbi:MAG: type II secretion system F family protein [Acidimicrobiales bacterium]
MHRRLAALAGALLLVVLAVAGLPSAQAQDDGGPRLGIREVDATDPENVGVTFFYSGDRDDLADLTLREGGRLIETTPAVPFDDSERLGVVLVMDTSGSMEDNALIERVREAALAFVEAKEATDEIAVVSFADSVRVEQAFTADPEILTNAIENLAVSTAFGTAMYDGIIRSSALYRDAPDLQPNLVVFTDGADTVSKADANAAEASVTAVGGTLFAMGVDSPGFNALSSIADETGGSAAVASDPAGVGALFETVQQTLRKQYVVTYPSVATGGTVPIELTLGSVRASAEYVAGSSQEGAAALRPQVVEKPSGPAFFRSSTGFALAMGLLVLAVIAAVFSVGSSFLGDDGNLTRALRPYSEGFVADPDADDGGDGKGQVLAQTPLLQRAVEATGSFAERQGVLTKVEALLERANLPLRPAEALFFYAAGVAVVALLLFGVAGSPLAALIGVVLVALIPPAVLSFLANRRRKQFESLLPDTLQLLASTLRAGYSLMQGVEAVSQEVSEPMGRELRRVVTEARLGRPLEEALDGIAGRMESGDFAWATMAIRIQREVGGNLAELLVTVAETMTERERLRRDVNALTAEGKISAIVLGILPVGLGGFIYSANPGYMDPLFDKTIGKIMLIGSILLAFFGFYWMKKTIEVDI